MSVVDIRRRDAVASRNNELIQTLRAHEAKTRALRSITNWISNNANLKELLNTHLDVENEPPEGSHESGWLKSNDLANGLYFNDSSIPYPSLTHDDGTTRDSKLNRPSAEPSGVVLENSGVDATLVDGDATAVVDSLPSYEHSTVADGEQDVSALLDAIPSPAVAATYSQRASQEPDGPVVEPDKVAPPEPEEEAQFSGATQELLDLETPQKPARVVHLPPEDVQEERMREVEEAERRRKSIDATDQSKSSRTHHQAQAELASSPSSTVGAYSAATPMPPQDSPDTSPDSESAEQIEVLPPKDLRPSPEEQREKEEHDRLLAAQKDIARRQALGDVDTTADEQLRWEERAAAARDTEETAARADIGGPEADAHDATEETQAEEVVEEMEMDQEAEKTETSVPKQDMDSVTEPLAVTNSTEPSASLEDGENINVAPRSKAPLTIDTTRLQRTSIDPITQPTPGEQERMTTRTASGVLQKRTVSEILGQTPGSARRPSVLSPEMISPLSMRHPQDTPATARPSSVTFQTPRRPPGQPGPPRTPSHSQNVLDELMILKGAALNPERDYLEPLFKIQAHDSPNVRTNSLPELIRSASKTLTTEDQFTTVHERLDYRILRRIYQLQNANKWSLRQMERAKEPEQSVSHHDHMMAEMQWMRKDFKAERKMRKSVCAWLAQRCAEWVAASEERRLRLQVRVKAPKLREEVSGEQSMPDLEQSGESAPEDDAGPVTPEGDAALPSTLVVPPELSETVSDLQKSGKLGKALASLPTTGFSDAVYKPMSKRSICHASKFVEGKVLPRAHGPSRKRSRYDYEDDAEILEHEPESKRVRQERDLPPEDQGSALFHPDNKSLRDRLHANNAFRPPSEFQMPPTQFYEARWGSQWIFEDDSKLKRLVKEYSFNWSLIADELQLPTAFKSSAERRTPWECFERWVELEQLPTEMKKTIYFKTWYQRLEQSQRALEERYKLQLEQLQRQGSAQVNQMIPPRRRTIPTRVEKRKATKYLWLVDAMRKGARKKEQAAYKQAESQRAAAQRKTQTEGTQPRAPMLTPQEFSKKRYERDVQMAEAQRQHRQKMMEAQQKQLQAVRAAQQQAVQQNGQQNGVANQQASGSNPQKLPYGAPGQVPVNGQAQPNVNGQMPTPQQQGRAQAPMAQRNGHLAVPQANGQSIPQAQMRMSNGQMPTQQDMQRMMQAQAQARGGQYPTQQQQQQYQQMQSAGSMQSPGANNASLNAQQQMQNNQALLLASMQAQMNNATHQQGSNGMSASPSMPPPPTPAQQGPPQQLSSGHVPAVLNIKAQIRGKFPHYTDEQVNNMATDMLKSHSQSTNQARQSAINAAVGINSGMGAQQANMGAYGHNQAAYQNANGAQMPNGNYANVNGNGLDGQSTGVPGATSPHQYANAMRQRQIQQMQMQQSPNMTHAALSGSPTMAHASPSAMTPVSPNMQYKQMAAPGMNMQVPMPRPPSRSNTPQMQRLGSSGSVPNLAGGGMQSPGALQGSPRGLQASMAR